jgi:predicted  nucleic acid-binding Zn-ribbon protein
MINQKFYRHSLRPTPLTRFQTAVPLPSSPRIKKSSTSSNFFGSSPSPLPAKTKSRRRSTSLSVDPRVQDLEAELDHLRSTQHNSGELDGLKLKLAAAITARDKIENQKLALEKSSRRELEELRTRLEELTDEVEYHRSNGSLRDNGEVEKVKKDLGARIASLEDVLRRKTDEIAKLEKQVTRMEELEAELDSEKSARRDIEAASAKVPAQTSSPELAGLQDKVALLEVELSEARATTPSSGSTSSAKQLRQLQRELDAAKREKDALQSELDQSDDILAKKDEEILHLRGALPLPGSPALGATPVDDGRVKELELQVESLQEEIRNLEASGADTVRSLEGQLETAKAALEQAKSELESSRIEGDKFRADAEVCCPVPSDNTLLTMQSVISQCDALKAEVKQTREALSAKEQDITAIETDLGDVREQLLTERTTMSDLQAKLSEAANLSDARTAEMAATLRTMKKSMQELEASESSTKQKHDALMLDAQRLEQDVEKLQAQLNDAEQKAQEAIASMQEQLASVDLPLLTDYC